MRRWLNIPPRIFTPDSKCEAVREGRRSLPCTNIIVTLQERSTNTDPYEKNQLRPDQLSELVLGLRAFLHKQTRQLVT